MGSSLPRTSRLFHRGVRLAAFVDAEEQLPERDPCMGIIRLEFEVPADRRLPLVPTIGVDENDRKQFRGRRIGHVSGGHRAARSTRRDRCDRSGCATPPRRVAVDRAPPVLPSVHRAATARVADHPASSPVAVPCGARSDHPEMQPTGARRADAASYSPSIASNRALHDRDSDPWSIRSPRWKPETRSSHCTAPRACS